MNWLSHADRRDGYIAMEIMLDKSTRSTLVKWLSSMTWPSSLAKFLRLGYTRQVFIQFKHSMKATVFDQWFACDG